MKLRILIPLSVLALLSTVYANDIMIRDIQLTDYGLFEEVSTKKSRMLRPDESIIDNVLIEVEARHKQTTDIVKSEIGVEFGILFNIIGEPAGKEVEIEVIHEHPPIYLPDKKLPVIQQSYFIKKEINEVHHALYLIENDREIVEGDWKISIKYKNKIYLEKVFKIIK